MGIHTVAPRVGRWLQDLLSAVKLFILAFIVCTGFAALGGHLRIPRTGNLDVSTSFKGTSSSGYNIGTALLDAVFSFGGYDNLNMVPLPSSLCIQIAPYTDQLIGDRYCQKSKTQTAPCALLYQLPWVVSLFSICWLISPTYVPLPSSYNAVLNTNANEDSSPAFQEKNSSPQTSPSQPRYSKTSMVNLQERKLFLR